MTVFCLVDFAGGNKLNVFKAYTNRCERANWLKVNSDSNFHGAINVHIPDAFISYEVKVKPQLGKFHLAQNYA